MITLNYQSETFLIKNSLDEFTILEFEEISKIINDKTIEPEQQWIDMFQYLGIPEYLIKDLDLDEYKDLMGAFDFYNNTYPIRKAIEIDNVKCVSFKTKFKITVREAILIDEYIRKDKVYHLAEILAILYKSPYMTKEENLDKKVIGIKAKYIRENITANVASPILNYLITRLLKNIPNE